MDISIVIPVFNEEDNLRELHKRIAAVMEQKLKVSYEIIFVDDGSKDKSYDVLKKLHKENSKVKIVKLRKNFGQSAAINAGITNSTGEIIITMDADLQNDPQDIPKLLKKLDEGFDVVSGWRKNRKDPIAKKLFSKFGNRMYKKLTGLKIHDSGCSLKAYKKESLENLELYGEMHRFIPALIASKGFKIAELEVSHHPRRHGKTKYGSFKLIKGFLDLFYVNFWTRYSARPLHYFGGIGILSILIGLIIAAYKTIGLVIKILILKQVVFVGPLLLFSVFLTIVGLIFIVFGFLAEINIRLYFGSPGKKVYEIEEFIE